ncbi:MAG TPA: protein-glutamate O-methyltransferase CheR [Gemmatimonadales bacterium]|nr:protein-glutamate O-methyltransferase CheR [Gemmatimonadales bacterium]
MMSSLDDPAFLSLTRMISERAGVSLDVYKDKCLRRRIAVRMRACGVHTYHDYRRVLETTPAEYQLLADALTINVTRFYRNPETWDRLRSDVIPSLLREYSGQVACWSAGCASGEEPYTLAMLCLDALSEQGRSSWSDRVTIDATDIDRRSLERLAAGRYRADALVDLPPALKERYLRQLDDVYEVSSAVRRMVRAGRLDLGAGAPLRPAYHLIICRNVVIYFDRPTQERLFSSFADHLVAGGYLVLGKVETLVGPARDQLNLVDARERIYRRPA